MPCWFLTCACLAWVFVKRQTNPSNVMFSLWLDTRYGQRIRYGTMWLVVK